MGEIGSLIVSMITVALVLTSGYLLYNQKKTIIEPINDYIEFNKYVRNINDLNYFLHGYQMFTEANRTEAIDQQLKETNLTRKIITDYYEEKIKNSVNHQDIEELFKIERFHSVFADIDQDQVNSLFNKGNYYQSGENTQLSISNRTFDNSFSSAEKMNKADAKAFEIFGEDIEEKSQWSWIIVILIVSILFLFIFQCYFIPITDDVYQERNKKSRRKEARMSKDTLNIHLTLHYITTVVMIIFIIIFYFTVNEFYEKTNKLSYNFLKFTKNYYNSLRMFQTDDMINIQNIQDDGTIVVNTVYKKDFVDSVNSLNNSIKLKIQFTELKDLYMKYFYTIDCNTPLIAENSVSSKLCNEYSINNKEKLILKNMGKTQAQQIQQIQYKTIYDENLIYDHFQILYCIDIIKQIHEKMIDFMSETEENIWLFFSQFAICLGFLFIFWVPFFKDKSKFKKEAKRFEMVNEL